MDRDKEKTIVTALTEFNGCVKHEWATKYAIDGMVIFDDRQPVAYLSSEEWEEFFTKYKTKIIKISRSTFNQYQQEIPHF